MTLHDVTVVGQGVQTIDKNNRRNPLLSSLNRLPTFSASGFVMNATETQGRGAANWLYRSFMQEKGWITRLSNVDGKLFNMSVEDWMSRVNTAIAMYIPQIYINFKKDALPWETVGRNVFTWFGTIALTAFIKAEKTSINSLFLNRFMKRTKDELPYSKVPKANGAIKQFFAWLDTKWNNMFVWLQNKKWLPKGFSVEPNDLYRGAGMRVGGKGLSWGGVSLEQSQKLKLKLDALKHQFGNTLKQPLKTDAERTALKQQLSNFFEFFTHEEALLSKSYKAAHPLESGIIEFARHANKDGHKFLRRVANMKYWQIAINTVLFAFLIGDLVMRLVWATTAKWDHQTADGQSRLDPNKKPAPVNIFGYRSLPARVVNPPGITTATPAMLATTDLPAQPPQAPALALKPHPGVTQHG